MKCDTFETSYGGLQCFPDAVIPNVLIFVDGQNGCTYAAKSYNPDPVCVFGRLIDVHVALETVDDVQSRHLVVTLSAGKCQQVLSLNLGSHAGQMLARTLAFARPDAKTTIKLWSLVEVNQNATSAIDLRYIVTVEQNGILLTPIQDIALEERIRTERLHLLANGTRDLVALGVKEDSVRLEWHIELIRNLMAVMAGYRILMGSPPDPTLQFLENEAPIDPDADSNVDWWYSVAGC